MEFSMFCADLSAQGLRPVRLSRTVNILPSDSDLVNNFFSFFELFFCTFSVQLFFVISLPETPSLDSAKGSAFGIRQGAHPLHPSFVDARKLAHRFRKTYRVVESSAFSRYIGDRGDDIYAV